MRFLSALMVVVFAAASGFAGEPEAPKVQFPEPDIDTLYAVQKRGLQWLARHQTEKGCWIGGKVTTGFFRRDCRCPKDGPNSVPDMEAVALSTLAFLHAGLDHRHGAFKITVKEALRFLRDRQGPSGRFLDAAGEPVSVRVQALCSLVFAECVAMSGSAILRRNAEKGLAALVSLQNEDGGFGESRVAPSDARTTAWAAMGLTVGRLIRVESCEGALSKACNFAKSLEVDEAGRFSMYAGEPDKLETPVHPLCATACCLYVLSLDRRKDPDRLPRLRKTAEHIASARHSDETLFGDPEFVLFATLGLIRTGGRSWKTWNGVRKKALFDAQESGECVEGSWASLETPHGMRGRAWTTAMALLAVAPYERSGKVRDVR